MIQTDSQSNKDKPPAYDHISLPPSSERPLNGYRNVGAPSPKSPGPSSDQVHILDKKNEIQGTFYIDPAIPSLDPSRNHRKGCKAKKLKLNSPIHASFFTRHKSISLNLGTAGNVANTPKANVLVSNRSKDININLLPMHSSQPRIGLEASSRKGNVVVYLPDDFQGVVHMEAMRGTVQILPVLQGRVKIANQSSREIILIVDTGETNHIRETSFCHLKTNKGNVVVGLSSGDDRYMPKVGIWQWIVGRIGALSS